MALRSFRSLSHFTPVTLPPILERGLLYLKRAWFGLWVIQRGILHLKCTCSVLWLIERGMLCLEHA